MHDTVRAASKELQKFVYKNEANILVLMIIYVMKLIESSYG